MHVRVFMVFYCVDFCLMVVKKCVINSSKIHVEIPKGKI